MIDEAIKAIEAGLVVGMPTDTVYGIGVDPLNDDAVSRLFDIKGRPEHKPIGILAATLDQAATIGYLEGEAADLAARHWPGALTLVVRPLVALAETPWVSPISQTTTPPGRSQSLAEAPMRWITSSPVGPLTRATRGSLWTSSGKVS